MTAPLAPGDAARLAALHAQALPRSLVALLGGLGTALVERAARDAARLAVVTEDDPANRAIAFYRKLGFVDSGPVSRNGKKFRRLAR